MQYLNLKFCRFIFQDVEKPDNKNETEAQRKKRLEGNQETLADIEREKEQLKADVERVSQMVTEKITEIAKLNGQISKLTEERLEDAGKVADATSKLTEEQKARKNAEGKVTGLESANANLMSENANLKADSKAYVELRNVHDATVQNLGKKNEELEKISSDLHAAKDQVKQLNAMAGNGAAVPEIKTKEIRELAWKIAAFGIGGAYGRDEKEANVVYDKARQRYAILESEQQQKAFGPGAARADGKEASLALPEILKASPVSFFLKQSGIKVAEIPAGSFDMGFPTIEAEQYSNAARHHRVQISKFEMGVYPVTQEEYTRVMGTNPSYFSATGAGKDKVKGLDTSQFPVDNISWFDAVEFCNKASEMDGLPTYYQMTDIMREGGSIKSAKVTILGEKGWRLPTEAEREYAARAGTTTPYFFGWTLNGDNANIDGTNPYGTTIKWKYLERTTKVDSYSPNNFGLFDMSGNVWQWCYDVYDEKAYDNREGSANDPVIESGSELRVIRGGSWRDSAAFARVATRHSNSPDYHDGKIGFRVAR